MYCTFFSFIMIAGKTPAVLKATIWMLHIHVYH